MADYVSIFLFTQLWHSRYMHVFAPTPMQVIIIIYSFISRKTMQWQNASTFTRQVKRRTNQSISENLYSAPSR